MIVIVTKKQGLNLLSFKEKNRILLLKTIRTNLLLEF